MRWFLGFVPRCFSFWDGFSGAFDLFGASSRLRSFRPHKRTAEETARQDAEAIASDWRAVGEDLCSAIAQWEARNAICNPPEGEGKQG